MIEQYIHNKQMQGKTHKMMGLPFSDINYINYYLLYETK